MSKTTTLSNTEPAPDSKSQTNPPANGVSLRVVDDCAVVGPPQQVVPIAAELRRAGIVTETYFSGSIKKQLKKAGKCQCAVLALGDTIIVKDMWTGLQKEVEFDKIVSEVREVFINGYYDESEPFEDFLDRIFS